MPAILLWGGLWGLICYPDWESSDKTWLCCETSCSETPASSRKWPREAHVLTLFQITTKTWWELSKGQRCAVHWALTCEDPSHVYWLLCAGVFLLHSSITTSPADNTSVFSKISSAKTLLWGRVSSTLQLMTVTKAWTRPSLIQC